MSWASVVSNPLRALLQLLPVLVPCQDSDCEGLCECWHAAEKCLVDDPVLESWSKQWLSESFGHVAPNDAVLLSLHVRVPLCLQTIMQTYSGAGGLYVEAKALDGRGPSDQYQVVWVPGASLEQMMVVKQTRSEVFGIARIHGKYGLRCRQAHAESLHNFVRPNSVYLPAGKKMEWLAGPFRTVRASLAQTLRNLGWAVRPAQAMPTSPGVSGMLYKLQSIDPPPSE